MTDVERLLRQYIEEDAAGADPNPVAFLQRADGADRAHLEAMIDAYLQRRPRAAFDMAEFRDSPAADVVEALSRSLTGVSGLWPSLLPRLRNEARVRRADLVAELADRLGAHGKRDKVADYYNQMEQGLLPAAGVSDTVLEALGKVVGRSAAALRRAGETVAPGGTGSASSAAPTFARTTRPQGEPAEQARGDAPPSEWDEVDRLFRGT